MPKTATLPDFQQSGKYKGNTPAEQWFVCFKYDFKRAGHDPPSPQLFLEYAFMLFVGKAGTWLRSTPRVWRLVEDRENATANHVEEFKEAACEQFPREVFDSSYTVNVYSEMESLHQEEDEPLAAYYQRSLRLLRSAEGKDKPKLSGANRLGALTSDSEEFIIGLVVKTFIKGLSNIELIRNAIAKDALTCGSMWRAYELVLESQRSLEVMRQLDQRLHEKAQRQQDLEIQNQQAREIDELRKLLHAQFIEPGQVSAIGD